MTSASLEEDEVEETEAEPSPLPAFVPLEELASYDSLDGLLLFASPAGTDVWEPCEPDYNGGTIHHGKGLFASGFALKLSSARAASEQCKFMVELNRRGDLTRANIRLSPRNGELKPSYRAAPYLICIRDKVVSVRYCPRRALILTLHQARQDNSWERFELRPATQSASMPHAARAAAFVLHGGSRKSAVKLSETGDLVAHSGVCDIHFAFAFSSMEPASPRSPRVSFSKSGPGSPGRAKPAIRASRVFTFESGPASASNVGKGNGNGNGTVAAAPASAVDAVDGDGVGGGRPPPGGSNSSPFEMIESIVLNEATGERVTHEKVECGTTRLETLHFAVRQPLHNLRRTTVTAKYLGFYWQNVTQDVLELGSYEPRDEPYSFEMPKAVIPNVMLARGRYRAKITYAAANHEDALRFEDVAFEIRK